MLGEPGERYNIRIDNPTAERVEVVVTIDGRDAVSGEVGDYVTQRGYLVEGYGSLLVEGFRRSLDEVAAFRFTDRARSYSARRGTSRHVGVIGVAVFPERPRPKQPVWKPKHRTQEEDGSEAPSDGRYRSSEAPRAGAPRKSTSASPGALPRTEARSPDVMDGAAPRPKGGRSNIGTEYGEDERSSVVEVAFERRSPTHPAALLSVRYDDYDGLLARGIDLSSLDYAAHRFDGEPDPFPRSPRRFAPPPPR